MASVKPPKYVRQVLVTLQSRGYPAYLVGGCVRDMLLGIRPQKWELCTGALPEQILALFPGSFPSDARQGVLSVPVDSHGLEVTTLRAEGEEEARTPPDTGRAAAALTADLGRRDFTINAIALSADGLIADPFGGAEDLRRQLIRCVGDPEQRFEDDPLRMFRAMRLSAKLGFNIDLFTMEGIRSRAPLAASLPAVSVRDEVEKLLLTPSPETLYTLIELGLLDAFLEPGLPDPVLLCRLARLPRKAQPRWAALCHVLRRCGCIRSAEAFLGALHLDRTSVCMAADCCLILEAPLPRSDLERKKLLRRFGVETVRCALSCMDAFNGGHESRELRRILKSGECFSLKHLAVSGDELQALGLSGRAVGEMLDFLLDYVMEFPDNNRRELLLALAAGSEE